MAVIKFAGAGAASRFGDIDRQIGLPPEPEPRFKGVKKTPNPAPDIRKGIKVEPRTPWYQRTPTGPGDWRDSVPDYNTGDRDAPGRPNMPAVDPAMIARQQAEAARLQEQARIANLPQAVRFGGAAPQQPTQGLSWSNAGSGSGNSWTNVGAGVGLNNPANPTPGLAFGQWLAGATNGARDQAGLTGQDYGVPTSPQDLTGYERFMDQTPGQTLINNARSNAAGQPTGYDRFMYNPIAGFRGNAQLGYNAAGDMSGARYGAAYNQYQNDPNQFYNPTPGSFGRGDWNYMDAMRYNTRSSLYKGGIGHIDPSLTQYDEGYGSPTYGLKKVSAGGGNSGYGYRGYSGWGGYGGGGGGYTGSSYKSPAWVTGLMNWRI